MSLGDDGYGGDRARAVRMTYSTSAVRARPVPDLPDGTGGDRYGSRRPARSSRSLTMVVGVVVLLVAAIAFANRGGGSGDSDSWAGAAAARRGRHPPRQRARSR